MLATRYRVFVKTEIPASTFDRLTPSCTVIPEPVDAGCVQKNFIEIDVERSFQHLAEFYRTRNDRMAREREWLKNQEIDLVLCDAPSLPLKAARDNGLPALLLANFTWHDIYSAFNGAGAHTALLECLSEEYACASLQILPQCSIVNPLPTDKEEVGFISLAGHPVRDRLEKTLAVSLDRKTVVFVYLGIAESSRVQWRQLSDLTECQFITRDPLPEDGRPENLAVLDERFAFPDLIASADVVLTKAGYATLATAFSHGKPVLSCSREDFREFEVMKHFLEENGVGLMVPEADFYACRWRDWIQQAARIQVEGNVRLNGAEDVAGIVDRYLNP